MTFAQSKLTNGGLSLPKWNRAPGAALVVVGALLSLGVFWIGFVSLFEAWQLPEYSHGPLIPLISAFLFLHHLRDLPPPTEISNRWPGVWIVVTALVIAFAGNVANIPDIVTYAFILWIWGVVLAVCGARRGWALWPAVLHLVFMLPLPNIIYWRVSSYLQGVASEFGVDIIQIIGIPVFLDGNIIDLGVYKLHVAEACSGLRYLFPIMSFSYIFAFLYSGPVWHKIILLLSAAPIAIFMNSVRIGIIGILVDNYGIGHAEGFLHAFEGWVIFLSCIFILFLEVLLLRYLTRQDEALLDVLNVDFRGLEKEALRIFRIPVSAALITAIAATGTFAAAWQILPKSEQAQIDRKPFALFPLSVGARKGQRQFLEPEIEAVLDADDYLSVSYTAPGKVPIDLFVPFYSDQVAGNGIHSPEVCIPAGGWDVSDWQTRSVLLQDVGGTEIPVNRAIIQKGLERQLVYYWFEQRSRRLTSDFSTKIYASYDALMMGRSDGGMVRLITPIVASESETMADDRLRGFMLEIMKILPEFVPN